MKTMKINVRVEPWLHSVFLVFILSFSVPINLESQNKNDYEWLIGYMADWWDAPRFAINKISFHSNPPDTIRTGLFGSTGGVATLSMANSNGELIFFSNGCSVYDQDGNKINGGEKIVEGQMHETHCFGEEHSIGYGSWVQTLFALPMDKKDSLFFMINHRYEWAHNTNFQAPYGLVAFDLQLSRIEQKENSTYELVKKKILVDTLVGLAGMVAIRDTKPNNWWLIVPPAEHLNNYRTIRLSPEGLDTMIVKNVDYSNFELGNRIGFIGSSATSPNGSVFAVWMPGDTIGTFVFDFDRTNGELSNIRHLPHPERDSFVLQFSSGGGGAAISPSGRFLYINTLTHLYQYDLHAEDIEASMVHIAEFDEFRDPANNLPTYFFMQQLGPDCRIYMSSPNTVSWLHVINYPDRKGLACDFQQHSFKLPGNHSYGLPYHPNYRLGTDYPVCDSTLTTTTWFIPEESDRGLHLYPNPARDYAIVGWSGLEPVEITVYDMSGREAFRSPMQPGLPEYYLDLSGFGAGVYVVRVLDRDGSAGVEKLVVFK
ncbi:MAG: T9SS C-terminal target domain-containing protein [Saprospirales bacterium]|nr:MAG: T9SS C-terminal target domain-containing protein [Saprospirales bacterium]